MPKVSNATRLPQEVRIVLADGRTTHIKVMPGARPDLPQGSKVDPNWLVENPRTVYVIEDAKKEELKPVVPKPAPIEFDLDKE